MTEYELHLQVAQFLTAALEGNSIWFHVGNGGYRHQTEARRLKAMGVLPGIPDIAVANDGRLIFIELKTRKGHLSAAQAWCHQRLRLARVPVSVCRSLADVVDALAAAGVPLRAVLS